MVQEVQRTLLMPSSPCRLLAPLQPTEAAPVHADSSFLQMPTSLRFPVWGLCQSERRADPRCLEFNAHSPVILCQRVRSWWTFSAFPGTIPRFSLQGSRGAELQRLTVVAHAQVTLCCLFFPSVSRSPQRLAYSSRSHSKQPVYSRVLVPVPAFRRIQTRYWCTELKSQPKTNPTGGLLQVSLPHERDMVQESFSAETMGILDQNGRCLL